MILLYYKTTLFKTTVSAKHNMIHNHWLSIAQHDLQPWISNKQHDSQQLAVNHAYYAEPVV
jgi:hypothetical protein